MIGNVLRDYLTDLFPILELGTNHGSVMSVAAEIVVDVGGAFVVIADAEMELDAFLLFFIERAL